MEITEGLLVVSWMAEVTASRNPASVFGAKYTATVAWGDQQYARFAGLIRDLAVERSVSPPHLPQPKPLRIDPPTELDLRRFGAVMFARSKPVFALGLAVFSAGLSRAEEPASHTFDAKGVSQSDHQIRRTMQELMATAVTQIKAGK